MTYPHTCRVPARVLRHSAALAAVALANAAAAGPAYTYDRIANFQNLHGVSFSSFGSDSLSMNEQGRVAFNASLNTFNPDTGFNVFGLFTGDGSSITEVVTDRPTSPIKAQFQPNGITNPQIQSNGDAIFFVAADPDDNGALAIYSGSSASLSEGGYTRIVGVGDTIGGRELSSIQRLTGANDTTPVFGGGFVGVSGTGIVAGTSLVAITGEGGFGPISPTPHISANGGLLFSAFSNDVSGGAGYFSGSPATTSAMLEIGDTSLTALGSPQKRNDDGDFAFIASDGTGGLFAVRDGALETIVQHGAGVSNIYGFDINSAGQIAYCLTDANGGGIYVDGVEIVDVGDNLGFGSIIAFGQSVEINDNGQVAFVTIDQFGVWTIVRANYVPAPGAAGAALLFALVAHSRRRW